MSWAQDLYDTYCACEEKVGLGYNVDAVNDEDQTKVLLPIWHILIRPNYIVTIREDGSFFKVDNISSKNKNSKDFLVIAPCTDNSEGRSGRGAINFPHPLFDQVKYLSSPQYSDNLSNWLKFLNEKPQHNYAYRMLNAVYRYVQSKTLKIDIPEAKEESVICFCVNIEGENENRLWLLPQIWEAWIDYQQTCILSTDTDRMDICYIEGKRLPYTEKHPKTIYRFAGNAKLISGNDTSNFTFRGRYDKASQAVTVSHIASQKIHQALRWLIATRGTYCDTQAIIAWAVDKQEHAINIFSDSFSIYSDMSNSAEAITDLNYGLALRRALFGSGNADRLKEHTKRIVILAVDAATKGRLSITYYRTLPEAEYHERIVDWHEQCSWYQPVDENKRMDITADYFMGAPSDERIVKAILGKKNDNSSETYKKLEKRIRERLLYCIMDGEQVPKDILNAVLSRASNPFGMENKSSKSNDNRWRDWEEVLCVACGLWKKHYYEKGDEYQLILDENRTDRDYLYGRLLAIADRIESVARYKQGSEKDKDRPTNAIRYMTAFSQHPFRTWKILWEQLNPYIQQLNGAGWYMNQIGSVMANFREGEFESDRPLDGRYLMGYFLQREALKQLKNKNNVEDDKNESVE